MPTIPVAQLFANEIKDKINEYGENSEITNAEVVGILELILFDIKMGIRAQAKENEAF